MNIDLNLPKVFFIHEVKFIVIIDYHKLLIIVLNKILTKYHFNLVFIQLF